VQSEKKHKTADFFTKLPEKSYFCTSHNTVDMPNQLTNTKPTKSKSSANANNQNA